MTSIGDYAFYCCSNLTTIELPVGLTSIGGRAFYCCSSLTTIDVPDGVTSIRSNTFYCCSSLTTVNLPDDLKSIKAYAFEGCSSLKTIDVPDSVTSIEEYAFIYCSDLITAKIPKSVVSIGKGAFHACKNLTIYGYYGSYAETYANMYNIPFNYLETLIPQNDFRYAPIFCSLSEYDYKIEYGRALDSSDPLGDGTITFWRKDTGAKVLELKSDENCGNSKSWFIAGDLEAGIIDIMINKEDRLPFDTDMYVTISEDVAHFEDGSTNRSFDTDDEWYFHTNPLDATLATNGQLAGAIPYELYKSLFGNNLTAGKMWMKDKGTSGICFGMSYAVNAWDLKYVGINSIPSCAKCYRMSDIDVYDAGNEADVSLLKYMQYAQIYQYTYAASEIMNNNKNELEKLYSCIKNYSNGTGSPLIISMYGIKGGHAITPIGIIEDTDSYVKVLVYDCNKPDNYPYLELYKTNGICTSWHYESSGFDSKNLGTAISYYIVNNACDNAFLNTQVDAHNLLMTKMNSFKINGNEVYTGYERQGNTLLPILETNGDTEETEAYSYWFDSSDLIIDSDSENFKETMFVMDDEMYTVQSDTPASVAVATGNENKITVTNTIEGTISIERTEYKNENEQTVKIIGTGTKAFFEKDQDTYQITGMKEMLIKTTDNIPVIVPVMNTEKVYQIQVGTEEGCQVKEDTTGDGNFDTVVSVVAPTEIGSAELEISIADQIYTGTALTPDPVIMDEGKQLVNGSDYTVEYENNSAPGTAMAIITGLGSYTGTVIKEFTIICEHQWEEKVTKAATALATGTKKCTCTVCGTTKTAKIPKLTATIKLNMKTIPLRVKQSTTAFKVSGLAKGDSVKSYKSSNTKVATVNSKGKITAKRKGTAKITVTLKSGKKATATVKVQAKTVKTTKIKVSKTKVTLKKGKSYTLKTVLTPLTSQQKVTYTSANKKIATVNSKGKIVAKKKGTVKITVKSGSKKVTVTVIVK